MKKLFLAVLMVLVFAGIAFADWSVTVTWTPSVGPNLANEKVLLDGAEKCSVDAGQPANCNFTVTDLTGQEVSIVSYNAQGGSSVPYAVGSLVEMPNPAPAAGGVITITIVP